MTSQSLNSFGGFTYFVCTLKIRTLSGQLKRELERGEMRQKKKKKTQNKSQSIDEHGHRIERKPKNDANKSQLKKKT